MISVFYNNYPDKNVRDQLFLHHKTPVRLRPTLTVCVGPRDSDSQGTPSFGTPKGREDVSWNPVVFDLWLSPLYISR